jgi:hypothetical protein
MSFDKYFFRKPLSMERKVPEEKPNHTTNYKLGNKKPISDNQIPIKYDPILGARL